MFVKERLHPSHWLIGFLFSALIFSSCEKLKLKEDEKEDPWANMYFPSSPLSQWETIIHTELQWKNNDVQSLMQFLEEKNTRAFIVLKNGRIALETYFGDTHVQTPLPWFSAGKTITAFLVGLAQEQGFINIEESTSKYLGNGWTSMTAIQEMAITVRDQLSMTTGLDYQVDDLFCTDRECLHYAYPAGTEWYYHNAPYTLLTQVIDQSVPGGFDRFFNLRLKDKIGMQGFWVQLGYNEVYMSNARSMARFGLLMLNNGIWADQPVMNDEKYFKDMIRPSQTLNKSYGYLWWLNGLESIIYPGSTQVLNTPLIPSAPDDLFAGLGLNDQKLYVVPSHGLVIVRLGGASGNSLLGPSSFDEQLWQRLQWMLK